METGQPFGAGRVIGQHPCAGEDFGSALLRNSEASQEIRSVLQQLRKLVRANGTYVRIRRYGIGNTWRRWRWNQRAAHTAPVRTRPTGIPNDGEVHVLTSSWDWDLAIWGLKSFYYQAQVDLPLVIHDGGGLSPEHVRTLQQHFPDARIILAPEADRLVNAKLQAGGYQATIRGRATYNLMKKVIDFAVLSDAPRILLLDSDILFFSRPTELLQLLATENDHIVLMRDYQDSYSVDRAVSKGLFGYELPSCINSGLGVIPTAKIDLPFIEEIFSGGRLPLDRDGFAEQTLLALLAARCGVGCLPESYEVVTGPRDIAAGGQIARHYVGPVKELFYDEGVPYLVKSSGVLQSSSAARPVMAAPVTASR